MLEIFLFIIALTLIVLAGDQDETSRKPIIIIPALFVLGLITNLLLGVIIGLIGILSLFLLPNKVNKILGKADIFLLISILVLLVMSNPLTTLLLWITMIIMTIELLKYYKKTKNYKKRVGIPLIKYFSDSFIKATIILTTITLITTILAFAALVI
jgi:hypothetical protein